MEDLNQSTKVKNVLDPLESGSRERLSAAKDGADTLENSIMLS